MELILGPVKEHASYSGIFNSNKRMPGDYQYHQYLNSSIAGWFALSFVHLFIQICLEHYVPGLVLGTRDRTNKTRQNPSLLGSISVLKETEYFYMRNNRTRGVGIEWLILTQNKEVVLDSELFKWWMVIVTGCWERYFLNMRDLWALYLETDPVDLRR